MGRRDNCGLNHSADSYLVLPLISPGLKDVSRGERNYLAVSFFLNVSFCLLWFV